ncbi:hypothetical protein PF008_g18272 [Phytophthora fragariae]|uniref:MULE transposase domain-containing protein n=1 Tax=Phytophthora fragariae TaxID=53985 RepID=A0A6G0R5U2_9STRA|nr:hypothetical protein PF008_g18272 [Phytophthora fragariae]
MVSHLVSRHEDFRVQYATHNRGTVQPLQAFGFFSEETSHRYHWLLWIVERRMSLCEVEDESHVQVAPNQLQGAQGRHYDGDCKAGGVITEEMGILFGLMFDGWSHGTMHFVSVFALYVVGGRLQRTLLALSPLDQGSQDAAAHIELFRNVLAVYNKTVDMVQFIVADNCNINRSIDTKLSIPLFGCASHRFKLAVNKFVTEHELLLQKVNNIMSQLRQINNAAELQKLTPLRAKKRNATR